MLEYKHHLSYFKSTRQEPLQFLFEDTSYKQQLGYKEFSNKAYLQVTNLVTFLKFLAWAMPLATKELMKKNTQQQSERYTDWFTVGYMNMQLYSDIWQEKAMYKSTTKWKNDYIGEKEQKRNLHLS